MSNENCGWQFMLNVLPPTRVTHQWNVDCIAQYIYIQKIKLAQTHFCIVQCIFLNGTHIKCGHVFSLLFSIFHFSPYAKRCVLIFCFCCIVTIGIFLRISARTHIYSVPVIAYTIYEGKRSKCTLWKMYAEKPKTKNEDEKIC